MGQDPVFEDDLGAGISDGGKGAANNGRTLKTMLTPIRRNGRILDLIEIFIFR
jgi:hypothetical protein